MLGLALLIREARSFTIGERKSASLSIITLSTAPTPTPHPHRTTPVGKVSPSACIEARNFKFGLKVAITLQYEIPMKKIIQPPTCTPQNRKYGSLLQVFARHCQMRNLFLFLLKSSSTHPPIHQTSHPCTPIWSNKQIWTEDHLNTLRYIINTKKAPAGKYAPPKKVMLSLTLYLSISQSELCVILFLALFITLNPFKQTNNKACIEAIEFKF